MNTESREMGEQEALMAELNGITRRKAAGIVHEWLLAHGERDEADIGPAAVLKDLYDCHECVNHVAQVYVKGIMGDSSPVFGMQEILSSREAAETAERACNAAKRRRLPGIHRCSEGKHIAIGSVKPEQYDCIMDLRSREEYEESHLPGAVTVPLEEFVMNPLGYGVKPEERILFVCTMGVKSRIASEKAAEAGFRDVWYTGTKE